ncbi:MAG: RNA polymerase factor sigma-54 [Janthinobacterium lividum]
MTFLSLHTRLSQTPSFSPRLQQAVRLLQMSTMDYVQELEKIALHNPFLELLEATGDDSAARRTEAQLEWAAGLDRMAGGNRGSSERFAPDDPTDALQRLPMPGSLRRHLHQQLGVLRLDDRERTFAMALVESLDDDGYLRMTLEEVARALGESGVAAQTDLRIALRRVQALDPVGVAARDVAECLSLQLAAFGRTPVCDLALRIVSQHLDLLASHKYQRLATTLQTGLQEVLRAVECIRQVEARPGARFGDDAARPVVPDAIVRKVNGTWKTALNRATMPRLQLHQSYASLFESNRVRGDGELKASLDEARWTVQNTSQRVSTILQIATAIVAKQQLFLEHGHLAMKPLGLREIADTVGVHPSTVSRAVHQKFLSTPHGVFELHHFFSRGVEHAGGGASAPVALQTLIRELITAESTQERWSDAALTRELGQQGFRIARRTVTKYRQGLNIPAVERRRSVPWAPPLSPAAGA